MNNTALVVSFLAVGLLSLAVANAENVVFQADFEQPSPQSPPPGWAMWGAEQFKVPAHFTRDTANPHSGQACFRPPYGRGAPAGDIHHPAHSAGYVVSHPDQAIRPKTGMAYRFSFWARADRPGASRFGVTAYESPPRRMDAPSPGFPPYGRGAPAGDPPYGRGAPAGDFTIEVGQDWRQFAFEVHEGWDFSMRVFASTRFDFAERSRHLMLTFKATTKNEEEKTLWVDDVSVTEQPSPRDGRLPPYGRGAPAGDMDEAALKYPPVPHRLSAAPGTAQAGLRPGAQLDVTLDATKRLGKATREAGGVSFHRVAGWTGHPYNSMRVFASSRFDKAGEYTVVPQLEQAIRDLLLPMSRFPPYGRGAPAGDYAVGDEPFGLEAAIDKAAEVCRRMGLAEDRVPLEFEEQGARTKLSPEVPPYGRGAPPGDWARGVRHSVQKGYKFFRWEVANEPYSGQWGHGGAFQSADDYVAHFKAVSAAIRAVQPEAHVGVAIHARDQSPAGAPRPYGGKWGNYVLLRAAGHYDFVVAHYYASANVQKTQFEDIALTENGRTLDRIRRAAALIQAYNPNRPVYQYDTEWGMHSSGPGGERADYVDRNANIVGTLHRAVRLIYYAREGLLRGASGWQMFSDPRGQGFGILFPKAPDQRAMLYWLYYYFNRHVGEWALDLDGLAPYHTPEQPRDASFAAPLTPMLATLDDQALYLVVANGSWQTAVPCRVRIANFAPARASATLLSHADLDAKPLLVRKEDFVSDFAVSLTGQEVTCTIPPHSVVFVTLHRG
ncbi:MAG: hypothetical protein FJ279_15395 [Planctomycetes bacterium]|nr:hypothetical protein [Planctomycetota bacterium]